MDTSNNQIEQLVAEAAARGAVAMAEEEARIAATLAIHEAEQRGKAEAWLKSTSLPEWTFVYAEVTLSASRSDYRAKLTLPGCVPILFGNGRRQVAAADRISVKYEDDEEQWYVSYDYVDWYDPKDFNRVVFEATQLYPAWQSAHAEVDFLNSEPKPTPAVTPTEAAPSTNPNSAESAGRLLKQFIDGDILVKYESEDVDMRLADDRAALIAAQLLSIGTSLERIANRLEDR